MKPPFELRCPSCGGDSSLTLASRPKEAGRMRRRECRDCGNRFSTIERVLPEEGSPAWYSMRVEEFSQLVDLAEVMRPTDPPTAGQLDAWAASISRELTEYRRLHAVDMA